MNNNKLLIFTPTYNERDNIEKFYYELKKYCPQGDILFLDDNSPDGTGILMDALAAVDLSVRIIHRPKKMGIGSAHRQAFSFAKEHNYDFLLTMDADFTHDPCYIPAMLAHKDNADVVIGSRYVKGGKLKGWGFVRTCLTYTAYAVNTYALGLPYDCTGAYRLYRVSLLHQDFYTKIQSNGYSFFIESLYQLKKMKCGITQVPIVAPIRNKGKSKISKREIMKTVMRVGVLMIDRFTTYIMKKRDLHKSDEIRQL